MSKQSRTDDPSWSVSAAFLDYDRDGWLDLFVGNYLDWRVETNTPCFTPVWAARLLLAQRLPAAAEPALHNNRDGTFTDVTAASGSRASSGRRSVSSTADFNGDGWIDIYVANDGQPNQLWINQRNGTFRNTGLLSGTALSAHGKAKAGMGVDAGDFDNDGDEDLFVTNLTGEGNDLYVNDGSGLFEEQSARSGSAPQAVGYTGFGTAWFDFDNDGWLDILTVNGAVQTIEALRRVNDPFPLHQRKLLFRNLGQRPIRGRHRARRRGVRVVGSRPRRRVRRYRQRRRRGRARGQQQRPAAAARQQRRQPQSLDRAAARGRAQVRPQASGHARRARRDRARRTARRSGAVPDRMEAMRPPTIRECWSVSASQRAFREFG